MKKISLITLLVFLLDQSLKVYIKTHFEIGESVKIFPGFEISFGENPGMAYGLHLGVGYGGKILLSILRLILSSAILWWIGHHIKKGASNHFIIPMSLIFAGAIGNLVDSAFYGLIFDTGMVFDDLLGKWISYKGISEFRIPGYSFFMGGSVVDMLCFPMIDSCLPEWVPYLGGQCFEFFKPIFNIADTAISIGVVLLLLFTKRAFAHEER
ncbi:MAG: lipoprotein signal peptidase [Flavobacteriales bacterium AspAUS03]